MKTYKVYTKWVGYSEIEVDANSPEEAEAKALEGDFSQFREASTGDDLDYGYEDEQVYKVEEIL